MLVALQCLSQQPGCLVSPPAPGQQPGRVLTRAGVLDQQRRPAGERDSLQRRPGIAADKSLTAQRQGAHRGHLRRQGNSGRDGAGHLGSDVAMTVRQGQAHHIGGQRAGGGPGGVPAALVARRPRGRVVAVDGSPAMVEQARERLGDTAEVFAADLLELELDTPVDAILSTATFHWIKDHDRLFERLGRTD